jgi:hypothetical protein
VVSTHPSEKYEFVSWEELHPILIIENKGHVPNHQPATLSNEATSRILAHLAVPPLMDSMDSIHSAIHSLVPKRLWNMSMFTSYRLQANGHGY